MATIDQAFATAFRHYEARRLQAAEEVCRQILQVQPGHAHAWHLAGLVAYESGRHRVAADCLRRAIAEDPNVAAFHRNLGLCCRAMLDFDGAAACYRRAVELQADYAEAQRDLCLVLTQQGKLDEATAGYRKLLELRPGDAVACNSLGIALADQGRFAEAVESYRGATRLRPEFAEAHNNLGSVYQRQGRPAEAIACYRRALELRPDLAEAHNNLGLALQQQGQLDRAVESYRRAIRLKPDFAEACNHLGAVLQEIGQREEAIACYRRVLELRPDDPVARHMLAATTGRDVPARAADQYVRCTFDSASVAYDERILGLGYRGPERIAHAAAEALGVAQGSLDVLDAGCGTGLCGPALRPYARQLIGVDLSPGMLEKAALRHVYDSLIADELTGRLERTRESYDLIASADTLNYFGDLRPVLAAAAGALRRDGCLIFTVEKADARDPEGGGFHLGPFGRYCHTENYVRAALGDAGLRVRGLTVAALRRERGHEVHGIVAWARKNRSA